MSTIKEYEMTPERLAYERSKIPKPPRRVRLTLEDFEDRDIDVLGYLWDTIREIKDPEKRSEKLMKLLGYMFPKIEKIDITNINQGPSGSVDLSKVPSEQLVDLVLREFKK